MRIVSGKYKGRAINPPRNLRARPTTDFAKENLFNVLGNLVDFEQCDVLDLFAGTGSISYEFASRGARSVTSVEINPVHYNFIRQTAAQLGIGNLYPVKANAFLYLKSCTKQFDVIFSDAPYDLEGSEQVVKLVLEGNLLRPLVQLVRIRACHARGQGFESPTHRQQTEGKIPRGKEQETRQFTTASFFVSPHRMAVRTGKGKADKGTSTSIREGVRLPEQGEGSRRKESPQGHLPYGSGKGKQ